jgi:2-oxoglutarate ferredoxin oxidoreductase subunit alpha
VAAINMVYGAAGAGARNDVLVLAGNKLKAGRHKLHRVRGAALRYSQHGKNRPRLGGILASQGDYFQSVKGGGHGDYHMVVYAPSSVQEAADLVMQAFDVADLYRSRAVLGDGMIGQMMEPVEFRPQKERKLPEKTWAATGHKAGRKKRLSTRCI